MLIGALLISTKRWEPSKHPKDKWISICAMWYKCGIGPLITRVLFQLKKKFSNNGWALRTLYREKQARHKKRQSL